MKYLFKIFYLWMGIKPRSDKVIKNKSKNSEHGMVNNPQENWLKLCKKVEKRFDSDAFVNQLQDWKGKIGNTDNQ